MARLGCRLLPFVLGAGALVWLILRSGPRPSRIAYPCQRAALASMSLAAPAGLVAWLARMRPRPWWGRTRVVAFAGLLALGFGGDPAGNVRRDAERVAAAPAGYLADLYWVPDAGTPSGDHHPGVDRLVAGMGAAGLKLHRSATTRSASGPDGIVRADDVVLIKVNQQWPERGGTNTDLLRGLIARVLEHPDGFRGEVVVVENGQGGGTFDWPGSNAEDPAQSVRDVVDHFRALGRPVSAWLWDGIRGVEVGEFDTGDLRDGYVVGALQEGPEIRVSYPKFRTAGGRYVSLARGIWDPARSAYDNARLRFLNLPVLKCHGEYGVTGAVKHHVGTMTTALATNAHAAVATGGIGSFLAQVRMPDLNILDCIYVLADPWGGPDCRYDEATRLGQLVAGRDPVALDLWAVTNVLVPAILANGHTSYPMQDPADPAGRFRGYLDRTAARILAAGLPVTNDPARIRVHVCGAVLGPDTIGVRPGPYPNPFAAGTSVRFVAARGGRVRLAVHDLTGRRLCSVERDVSAGPGEIQWDGRDGGGRLLPAGNYLYRVTGPVRASGKLTLVR